MAMNTITELSGTRPGAQPGWHRRHMLALCGAAAMVALAWPPAAHAGYAASRPVEVEVLDRDAGAPLRLYRDHGRPVVAGRPGARYGVRLVNTSGERVLAVVAIDGVNVISGETAAVGQRGYVLEPWQTTVVYGWRKSDDEVAAFEFTALSDSYAARTGRPLDVGVIGVAVFREAPQMLDVTSQAAPEPPPEALAKSAQPSARAATGAAAAAPPQAIMPGDQADAQRRRPDAARAPTERLGTGHGARENSVARVTTFERASAQPTQRIEIRYDSLPNLIAAGIVPPPRVATTTPHSFPADPHDYVPDPPAR
jgi:hypothetical protein